MQKPAYTVNPKNLIEEIEKLKQLKIQLNTESTILQQQKGELLKSLNLETVPDDLDAYIAQLVHDLETDLAAVEIPEDLINDLNRIRGVNHK